MLVARPDRLLTQVQVCRAIPISVRTWRRWRTARLVPAPVPNIPGWPRWREADIVAFKRGLRAAGGRRVHFGAGRRIAS